MASTGKGQETVYRWLQRFREEGVDRLLRDRTRPPDTPHTSDAKEAEVVALTRSDQPAAVTHWTSREVAQWTGISQTTVLKIWKLHGLAPHRWRTMKFSKDPLLRPRRKNVEDLYGRAHRGEIVLSLDQKRRIQVLQRMQPRLPIAPGHPASMTHDYVRNDTVTLFAAVNVATGELYGLCTERHTNVEMHQFLECLQPQFPTDRPVHVILDNYATHKHQNVRGWLQAAGNWHFHFTPTSAS